MYQEPEYLVLRVLFALEAGRNALAKDCFRKALGFWGSRAGANFARRENGTPPSIARHCLEVLSSNAVGTEPW